MSVNSGPLWSEASVYHLPLQTTKKVLFAASILSQIEIARMVYRNIKLHLNIQIIIANLIQISVKLLTISCPLKHVSKQLVMYTIIFHFYISCLVLKRFETNSEFAPM